MAEGKLFEITKEQYDEMNKSIAKMKAIVDNKEAMIATGIFTKEEIDQIQSTYNLAVGALKTYAPK